MAKPEKGKIKIRFFEVELEGSDETLLESVRSATSLANRGAAPRPMKQITAPAREGNGGSGAGAPTEESVIVDEEATDSPPVEAPSSRTKKPRHYRAPNVLDLDLKSGPVPLESFFQSKQPGDTMKQYLVIAAWLKEHRNTSRVNVDHIYTCLKALGLGAQRDVAQPLRSGKSLGYYGNSEET